ncbi:hypothetical protein HFP51_11895 [Parasphingopyxis sp. CP4]|uniref:energy transducer TonB n=1 Tax=Parasphingopyxis sp. CP4 TaxID=2724527 RepID=UPI0015A059C7|nr:energy transducer TonB [Parasphingopyxis sp. CP4]QLC22820.1 hypothetical protein HFP51_11895 [Parasphingopyxis sp. CP4]
MTQVSFRLIVSVTLAAFGLSTLAVAQTNDDREMFRSDSNWQTDYGYPRCRVLRTFTDGDQTIFLMMDRSVPPDRFTMTIGGVNIPRRQAWSEVQIIAQPQATSIEAQSLRYRASGDLEEAIQIPFVSTSFAANWSDEQILEIRLQGNQPVRILLTDMQALFASWESCQIELLELVNWNLIRTGEIPEELHAPQDSQARAATPRSNPGQWIHWGDYPPSAILDDAEGTIPFILFISDTGEVTDCAILETSGDASLDAIVCGALTARATFEPATDESGEPVRGTYQSQVRFQLP